VEIERKFLVESAPAELGGYRSTSIEQGYLSIGADGSEVRIRRRDDALTLTVKSGRGLVRDETEVELSAEQFEALWPATAERRIEKTRYEIPASEGLVIELDVYRGALDGLVVAEVEFPSEEASGRFAGPGWFGVEVTTDDAYKNRALAVDGRPTAG
jgi:CYTH domain-containing protein